ncbi:MAG: C-type lectin domain-containing protein [Sphingomonadales bacterium]
MLRLVFSLIFVAGIVASAGAKGLYGKPIYNPETRSYFELVRAHESEGGKKRWFEMERFARAKIFKGVQGRLAKVKSASVNFFLMENLRPDEASWIGLYLDCSSGKWAWSDGEAFARDGYTNWHPTKWDYAYGNDPNKICDGNSPYAAVAYYPIQDSFRWFIKRKGKGYDTMIVEYPTGGE